MRRFNSLWEVVGSELTFSCTWPGCASLSTSWDVITSRAQRSTFNLWLKKILKWVTVTLLALLISFWRLGSHIPLLSCMYLIAPISSVPRYRSQVHSSSMLVDNLFCRFFDDWRWQRKSFELALWRLEVHLEPTGWLSFSCHRFWLEMMA